MPDDAVYWKLLAYNAWEQLDNVHSQLAIVTAKHRRALDTLAKIRALLDGEPYSHDAWLDHEQVRAILEER